MYVLVEKSNDNGNGYNHRHTRKYVKDKDYDKLLKEIVLIDKWCNYGANNGLFNGKHHNNLEEKNNLNVSYYQQDYLSETDDGKNYNHIHEELKKAQDSLDAEKFSDSMKCIASARIYYLKALFSKSWLRDQIRFPFSFILIKNLMK